MTLDQECNDCGASEWKELLETSYPEHRRERDQTVEIVFDCANCGAQGKRFEDGQEGTTQFTGALR